MLENNETVTVFPITTTNTWIQQFRLYKYNSAQLTQPNTAD